MPKKKDIKFSSVTKSNKQAIKRAFYQKAKAKNGKKALIFISLLLILAIVFITINEKYLNIDKVPKWNDIFGYLGLFENDRIEFSGEDVSVHFIDVGQGDSGLIITPEYNILIDSGERENYTTVLSYLSTYEITTLHYVVATHPHSDHIGGLSFIINSIKTEKIIMPNVKDEIVPTTSSYINLLDSIEENNVEVIYAAPETSIDLGGGTLIEILAPVKDYNDLNNYSIVLKLVHGNNSFLFTGDMEKESENDILDKGIDVSADVLSVAHHGSKTSSTFRFLKAVGGEYAVISVGMPNSYNHPSEDILLNLSDTGYNVYRTDLNGNIVFTSDGNKLKITTQKNIIVNNLEDAA